MRAVVVTSSKSEFRPTSGTQSRRSSAGRHNAPASEPKRTMTSPGWIALVLATSAALGAALPTTPTTGSSTDVDEFAPYKGERFDEFDWALLQSMASHGRGNILISPISLKLALVMLYEGAQEDTARELAKALRLPARAEESRARYTSILRSLEEKSPEYTQNYGNRIYLDNTILPRQSYAAILEAHYRANLVNASFADSHSVALMINDFASNVTNGRISKLIDDEQSLKDDLMLIASALYFQGNWDKQPFDEKQTRLDKFYLADKTAIEVPYMRASKSFYATYAEELNSKILRIPYAGRKYAMYFVLPQSPGQLNFVLQKITPKLLAEKMSTLQLVPVDVLLPKFQFDFTSHLQSNLRELGIRDIFEATATLTGIQKSKSTSRRLAVSDVVQKAGIEINEKGTTAYVATTIELGNKMGDETFHATHPFLFYIEDESTGTITYMGIVDHPLETSRVVKPPPALTSQTLGPMPGSSSAQETDDYLATQNFFNIELLNELCAAKPGNVVVGSSSVKAALMVLAEAAAGRTRQQIVASLRLPTDPAGIRRIAGQTIGSFKDAQSGTELQSAMKLWTRKDVVPANNLSDALRYYGSDFEAVDFGDVATSARTVNDWVRKRTNGLIDSIVDQDSLDADTKALLTTAVYFRGTWLHAFDKTATRLSCFNVPRVGCKDVPLMESIKTYKYAEIPSLRSEVVQIPYIGNRVAMLVLLPKSQEEDALEILLRDLAFTPLPQVLRQLEDAELFLQLPRFSVGNKLQLQSSLGKLKITDLFDSKSNLTAGFPNDVVQVGAVLHNARIEVSEEGTIAAAATGVSVIPLMGTLVTNFRVDRPFAFLLLDLQTNNVLFAGRYVQPEP
ncbi:uncharacterized protein LOC131667058 [Phymastichus coffea]|uniref:uncharacterized protein LOC131667058 n=1 Tax=Phymastichus coffea TaxID=108790 RepID=UPI00273CD42B|nr:uncharacterized protein LOC131667058 [Phymastichus coffea]